MVEVIRAWPRGFEQVMLQLSPDATVAVALAASGLDGSEVVAYAVFGEKATLATVLRDGDRVEVYRPLLVDPKLSRRERFRRQGARAAGLFAGRNAGAKAGT